MLLNPQGLRILVAFAFAFALPMFLAPGALAQEAGVVEMLPEKLEDARGKKLESSSLSGKYIGLYFSAGWCPPCRAFTPSLVEFRNRHAEEGFEIVFVSFDRSNADKQKYVRKAEMPWPSIIGAKRRDAQQLAEQFSVDSLPTLVILSPDGEVVTVDGRAAITSDPENAFESWKKASQS